MTVSANWNRERHPNDPPTARKSTAGVSQTGERQREGRAIYPALFRGEKMMTTITTAQCMKDVPKFYRGYYIGKNENGEVNKALAEYEEKYHEKPVAVVIYRRYLFIPKEEK